MNVEMLTKLMMMTTSSHDGEALNAIRMANQMLSKHKLSWQDVTKTIRVPPKPKEEPTISERAARAARAGRETHKSRVSATEIRRMFAYLRKNLEKGPYRDFIAGIHEDWRKFHKLTDGQLKGLEKVYRHCLRQNGHDDA
jgi:hypothetical protein